MNEYRKGDKIDRIIGVRKGKPVVVGSKGGFFCCQCGHEVMLAPSGRRILEESKCKVICLPCFQSIRSEKDQVLRPQMGEMISDIRGDRN